MSDSACERVNGNGSGEAATLRSRLTSASRNSKSGLQSMRPTGSPTVIPGIANTQPSTRSLSRMAASNVCLEKGMEPRHLRDEEPRYGMPSHFENDAASVLKCGHDAGCAWSQPVD